jgi:uncharacterized membrane protein YeaQ/YmgE (transglycosylase-associated protein family)
MALIAFLLFGIIVGFLARALMPGRQSMGLLMTMVLGVVGSFIGGFLGSMLSGNDYDRLHPAGILGSVVGALIVLAITGMGRRRLV